MRGLELGTDGRGWGGVGSERKRGEGVAKENWSRSFQVKNWGVDEWGVAWETQEMYFILSHPYCLLMQY